MYPLYDIEGQLEAHRYMMKRLEEGGNSVSGFITTLAATILAATVAPAALWLYIALVELSNKA